MNEEERERLIALLVALIMDGAITEAQAQEIIDTYDATGDLPDGWQLPLLPELAIPSDLDNLINAALLSYLGTMNVSPDEAQDVFMAAAVILAREVVQGAITVEAWHWRMVNLLINYLAQQAQTGSVNTLSDEGRQELGEITLLQLAFLARFADSVATNRQSEGEVMNRAQMYAGEGRAQWFRQNGITNAQFGWVMDYIAVDDRFTCQPCAEAEARGPYLPNDASAPLPGRICLGRGYCRCTRELRYDPPAYRRLTGA